MIQTRSTPCFKSGRYFHLTFVSEFTTDPKVDSSKRGKILLYYVHESITNIMEHNRLKCNLDRADYRVNWFRRDGDTGVDEDAGTSKITTHLQKKSDTCMETLHELERPMVVMLLNPVQFRMFRVNSLIRILCSRVVVVEGFNELSTKPN